MSGKYGEPWRIAGKGTLYTKRGEQVGKVGWREKEARARRICLAVNACAGLSDSALESGVIERVREALEQLIAWRDAVECISPELGGLIVAMDRARAALALLEAKP